MLLHTESFHLVEDTHCLEILDFNSLGFLCHTEELSHVLLLELVVVGLDALMKPVGVLDLLDRVHAVLKSSWDGHNLLYCATKSFLIIVPV